MVEIKEIEKYLDYGKCISISNGIIEAYVTVDIGPRIIRFSFKDGNNIMNTDRVGLGQKTDDEYEGFFGKGRCWESFGGHRIWTSPESYPATYTPDDKRIDYEITKNGAVFTAPEDIEVKTQKQLEIKMDENSASMKVFNRVKNTDIKEQEFSVWAITVCAAGGNLIIPLNTDDTGLLSNRFIAIWPYTDIKDERIIWENKYMALSQKCDKEIPIKLGFNSKKGIGYYVLGDDVFCKKYNSDHLNFRYPDGDCSFETYTNNVILEFETLNELKVVNPGETSEHIEEWKLFKKPCEVDYNDEKSIENFISKL